MHARTPRRQAQPAQAALPPCQPHPPPPPQVFADGDPQPQRRLRLFAVHQIAGQVLGHLACAWGGGRRHSVESLVRGWIFMEAGWVGGCAPGPRPPAVHKKVLRHVLPPASVRSTASATRPAPRPPLRTAVDGCHTGEWRLPALGGEGQRAHHRQHACSAGQWLWRVEEGGTPAGLAAAAADGRSNCNRSNGGQAQRQPPSLQPASQPAATAPLTAPHGGPHIQLPIWPQRRVGLRVAHLRQGKVKRWVRA